MDMHVDLAGTWGNSGKVEGRGLAMQPDQGSITHMINLLKAGDGEAACQLWGRYFQRLVDLARVHLSSIPRRASDEEDVAISVFDSLFRRAERGQFARLDDRGDLWQLLYVLTVRKAVNLAHHERRGRRGGGKVVAVSDLAGFAPEDILDREPTPELAAQVADECRKLLASLEDETLKLVAQWKMEGYTNAEIARRIGCIEQTVERKLRTIRRIWSESA
jgi:DNA-directed RNA polymerase specialized sigma24 family protein